MLRLRQIAYTSIISTSRHPRWWILALLQLIGLVVLGSMLARPHLVYPSFAFWFLAGALKLIMSTVLLWLEVEAARLREFKKLASQIFTNACFKAGGVIICSIVIIALARFIYSSWLFLALFSSLVAATAVIAMLYIVLCGQPFFEALVLAFDTWNKKTSLAAAIALVLILAHGISFAFVHGMGQGFWMSGQFSVFSHSATIWVLFLGLLALAAFLAATLNCFLVLLFLEIIRRKKDPESLEEPAPKLAPAQAHN